MQSLQRALGPSPDLSLVTSRGMTQSDTHPTWVWVFGERKLDRSAH